MSARILLRSLLVSACVCGSLLAATIRLYLTDGSYQLAREYKVEGDKVSFLSAERGEWEDLPTSLVDLKKTEAEVRSIEESTRAESAITAAEDKAERDAAREFRRVPKDPGVYAIEGDQVVPLKVAESKVVNNKGRNVLKVLSPLPLVSGRQWLEVDGLHSVNVVHAKRPEFYFRLSTEERFGMVRMGERKGNRVLEQITIIPVSEEIQEEPIAVDTFRHQLAELVYKIWPEKDLPPGEYALVEYTAGKVNMQAWDFSVKP